MNNAMKRIFLLIIIISNVISLAIAQTIAVFGEYGIQYQESISDYKSYIGTNVVYVPSKNEETDRKVFLDRGGKYNTVYMIYKISGNENKMKWTLIDKSTKKEVAIFIKNKKPYSFFEDRNIHEISKEHTVQLLLIDKIKSAMDSYNGKYFPENSEINYEITNYDISYNDGEGYDGPWHSMLLTFNMKNSYNGSDLKVPNPDKIKGFSVIGTTIETEEGKTWKVVSFSNHLIPNYIVEEEGTGNTKILKKDDFSRLKILGHVYTDTRVKHHYTVTDVIVNEKDNKITDVDYVLTNSETGKTKKYSDAFAAINCFKDDLGGKYVATLKKVQKPDNPSVRYGKTLTVSDGSITKFSYVDNVIDILIFNKREEFSFVLKNVSNNSIKVIWNEAAYVDSDGSTSRIMHVGTRYSEKDGDQPATTIISGAKIEDVAVPTNNVRFSSYSHDWYKENLFPYEYKGNVGPVRLMLPIQVKNVINEYVFIFDVKYVYDHPERLTFK